MMWSKASRNTFKKEIHAIQIQFSSLKLRIRCTSAQPSQLTMKQVKPRFTTNSRAALKVLKILISFEKLSFFEKIWFFIKNWAFLENFKILKILKIFDFFLKILKIFKFFEFSKFWFLWKIRKFWFFLKFFTFKIFKNLVNLKFQ